MSDAPNGSAPQFTRVGEMLTATWTAGNDVYVLAGRGDDAFLRRYL